MKKHVAFTMAEILLSLTIIGIVAAITLPSLTGNINERTWNTQRKALYARFSQAIALMPSLNGYGNYINGNESTSAVDTATETFITEGLSKVLKINNICDHEHLADCGIVNSFTNLAGSTLTFPTKLSELNPMFTSEYTISHSNGSSTTFQNTQKDIDTKAAAFETQNGESIAVFYNPNCIGDEVATGEWHYSQPRMCANFIYDLNGNKGPNTVGKDIGFITALYPTDPIVVAPLPLPTNAGRTEQYNAGKLCQQQDSESRVPNREEVSSMFYNKRLVGIDAGPYWSSTMISSGEDGSGWTIHYEIGRLNRYAKNATDFVRCIKR